MASIKSQLALTDSMSPVLRKITSALKTCVSSFERMQSASGQTIDVNNLSEARQQLEEIDNSLGEISGGQKDYNNQLSQGVSLSGNLLGKVAKLAAAYLGVRQAVNFYKEAIQEANEAQTINTQLAVTLKNAGLGQDAYDQLTNAAKQYGMYTDTAMTAAAAEFATYMSDSDAVESMLSTLSNYMVGMSGGGALDTTQVVDYATQLGKVLNGTFDGIAKKGFTVSDAQKEILKSGTDMEKAAVVADIINESWGDLYKTVAATPQGELISLQNTISQMKEDIGTALMPTAVQLMNVVKQNMPTIQALFTSAGDVLTAVIPILVFIANAALKIANFFVKNWSWISPIVWGIVAALTAYKLITLGVSAAIAIHNGLEAVKAAKSALATGATFAETAAQWGLNTALYACPLTWIIVLIVALIAIIIVIVIQIKKWIDSVGGLNNAWAICKAALIVAWAAIKIAFYAVYMVLMNLMDKIKLGWKSAGVAIANFMGDLKVSVLTILQNMINGAIDIINKFIKLLNKIPGVNIQLIGHVTFATEASAQNEAAKQARNADLENYRAEINAASAEREATMANLKSELSDATTELSNLYNSSKAAASNADEEASLTDSIADLLAGVGGDTSEIADSVSSTDEDLAYLRDIAEQEAINRFTTAEVKIDMTGMTNKIDSQIDLDGVINTLTEGFAEALATAAEGVHA